MNINKKLKILIPLHTLPEIKSITILELENLLPILKNKTKIQIIWFVYTPEKLNMIQQTDSENIILDIHNYKNALDVIQEVKPDIIYADPSWSFIDYAFSSTAKLLNIPVFCIVHANYSGYDKGIKKNITSNFSRFFQNSIPTDNIKNKKKIMKRGRFFLYKYFFLLQTMLAIKKNRFQTIFMIWKFIFLDKLDPKFASETIQFLENAHLKKHRLSLGFKESNLITTGNPMYDSLFFTIQKLQSETIKKMKFNILLVTTALYEHGIWTRRQRDFAIKDTLKQLKNIKDLNLTVKIHPSSEILSEYELLVKEIIPNATIHQKGNVENFINESDLVVSFPASSVLTYAILMKKPLVVCNYFNMMDFILEKNPMLECNDPSFLLKKIDEIKNSNLNFDENRNNFIKEFLSPFDGHAKDRICDKIFQLVDKISDNTKYV